MIPQTKSKTQISDHVFHFSEPSKQNVTPPKSERCYHGSSVPLWERDDESFSQFTALMASAEGMQHRVPGWQGRAQSGTLVTAHHS